MNVRNLTAPSLTLALALVSALACKRAAPSEATLPSEAPLGQTCQAPLPIAGRIALKPFPADASNVVTLSGDVAVAVEEGAVGLVRHGSGHALATRIGDSHVSIPGSENALHVMGANIPGTSRKILVFSRTPLAPRGSFAGQIVYETDRAGWSLEMRVLDGAGHVVASRSLQRASQAVTPVDIDITGDAGTVSVLVQLDRRGALGGRPYGDEKTSPLAMQIVEVRVEGDTLIVEEKEPESVTQADLAELTADFMPPSMCAPTACGPMLDPSGREISCGDCDSGRTCANHVCRKAACRPAAREKLCGEGACGKRYDGCSAIIDCGGCADGLECNANEPGKCGDPRVMRPEDVRAFFGERVCGCFADERGATTEVACDAGERCDQGRCAGGESK